MWQWRESAKPSTLAENTLDLQKYKDWAREGVRGREVIINAVFVPYIQLCHLSQAAAPLAM